MRLRDVTLDDVEAYVRMRCDPAMMSELGGPVSAEEMPAKVERDVRAVQDGSSWIKMIVPDGADGADGDAVAGTVSLWSHEEDGEIISEMGWMVLPEFQGRGLAKHAVRQLLADAREDGRWGIIHAFPGVTNGPSNGLCRSLGFKLLGEREILFNGKPFRSNEWVIDAGAL
ncbi:MAG TPA: GNAT family N-acetyltransferase [Candidatus Limnocylindrales bacterium]